MNGANPPPRYFDIHPTSNNSALPQQNEAPLNSEVASSSSASSEKEPHPDQFTEITQHETGLSSRDNGTGRRKSAFHRISRKVTKPFASKPGGDWRDCVFLISTILFVGSLIAIAIVGALVIRPYILVKSFTETNCTVVSAVLGTTTTRCSCGSGNICKYNCQKPCMRVKVSYKDPTSGLNITTKLSKTELGLIDECYSDNYGPITSSFTCLYNPDRLEQVIIYRTLNLAAAVNSILWFGILFLATSAFLIYYFLVYREYGKTIKKKLCKNKEYIAYP